MSVIIGSARINEKGTATGGKHGDQTGWEVATEEWYKHSLGWVVLRAKDEDKREWLAKAMEQACENDLIGYDQDYRNSLYKASKDVGFTPAKVTKACSCDCSSLVRICCLYSEINVGDFYTGNEMEMLRATGQFDVYTDAEHCDTSANLMRGDILVTMKQGHTAIVLSDGTNIHEPESPDELEAAARALTERYDELIAYLAKRTKAGDFGNGETR